ncbi:SDR family NAD(P)-dependent oxidoreductase [Fodinicurvata sediminis]|uniref:SDR family NAD(P)-dependent oxidoreductase n=1 Tax=Fodinicurvata sediminis TaxID=1121832 RepID=UPI0003B3FACE|nr:SDR family NAD(P)-dependent oxidoreductase [Fodinicurvata sediminis]
MSEAAKCAWITGASSGLGRELALQMARDGWSVAVSARSAEKLDSLVSEAAGARGGVVAYPLDVTDAEAVNRTVARIESELGPVDQAVLNAGTHQPTPANEFKASDFRKLVDLNLMGTIHCLEVLIERFRARRAGRIAVVASVAGYTGLPQASAYGMTKAGLINLCEALRVELKPDNITVQVVNPGFVRTPLTDRNDFPMPFLMDVEDAACALYKGLSRNSFEITFPRRFTYMVKLLRILPYPLKLAVTARMLRRPEAETS